MLNGPVRSVKQIAVPKGLSMNTCWNTRTSNIYRRHCSQNPSGDTRKRSCILRCNVCYSFSFPGVSNKPVCIFVLVFRVSPRRPSIAFPQPCVCRVPASNTMSYVAKNVSPPSSTSIVTKIHIFRTYYSSSVLYLFPGWMSLDVTLAAPFIYFGLIHRHNTYSSTLPHISINIHHGQERRTANQKEGA